MKVMFMKMIRPNKSNKFSKIGITSINTHQSEIKLKNFIGTKIKIIVKRIFVHIKK